MTRTKDQETTAQEAMCLSTSEREMPMVDDEDPLMIEEEVEQVVVVDDVRDTWPDALIKATMDPFDYTLQLRSGQLIRFEAAHLTASIRWVHLTGVSEHTLGGWLTQGKFVFSRGVDVRVDEIAWVSDAGGYDS